MFLCYGSLWGEIRQSRLLPWSHKAELCILEDQLNEYGHDDFVKDFERNHMSIRHIAADGYYYIESNSIIQSQSISKPYVEIFIFAKDRQVSQSIPILFMRIFEILHYFAAFSNMFTIELAGAVDFCLHIVIGRRHFSASPHF